MVSFVRATAWSSLAAANDAEDRAELFPGRWARSCRRRRTPRAVIAAVVADDLSVEDDSGCALLGDPGSDFRVGEP